MEEERYYEFTGETKKFYDRVVHRIRCTKDFRDYKAGDVAHTRGRDVHKDLATDTHAE